MFRETVDIYDAVYRAVGKDYAAEAEAVHRLIQEHKQGPGNLLLDVACGTGAHLDHFRRWYRCRGIDLDPGMVEYARRRLPEVPIEVADMVDFDLERRFQAIVCLFSSIGYVGNTARLRQAVATMAVHLEPGGVLVVEPWFTPETFEDGYLGAVFVEEPELKVARLSVSERDGRTSVIAFQYLIGTPEGVRHVEEVHEMGLFTDEEYREAFREAGLEPRREEGGFAGRGLYWAVRPEGSGA